MRTSKRGQQPQDWANSYWQLGLGDPRAATIVGTAGNDLIHRDGDGQIAGFGETEFKTVTTGNDRIDAGNGDDRVYADLGDDRITLGTGSDLAFGDDGDDTIIGNNGNDTMNGGQGADTMTGGAGTDAFLFNAASELSGLAESIDGGADVDTIDLRFAPGPIDLSLATIVNCEVLAISGSDVTLTAQQLSQFRALNGSFGADRFVLSAAGTVDLTGAEINLIDEFRGSSGADTFTMTRVLTGQIVNTLAGADTVNGGDGADIVDGGTGNDTLSGADGNDQLFGGDDADTLTGGIGNDLLVGGVGLDTLTGGAGNDDFAFQYASDISGLAEKIAGGDDYDYLDFAKYQASGFVDLTAAKITGMEELDLGATQVLITAAQLSQFRAILGGFGNDTVTLAGAGTVDLTGATFSLLDGFFGSSGDDTFILTGATPGQTVDGRDGADTLLGSAGADTFLGGGGADTITGGEGHDVITGGQGVDTLSGGVGNDTFRFAAASDISGLAEKINGGADTDTLDFQTGAPSGPIDLSLATLTNLETLALSNNDVTLTATQMGMFTTIFGGFGPERLILSAAGIVDLTGAAVSLIDEFRGTAGDDTFLFTGVADGQTVNGLDGKDTITGGLGQDTLNGGLANDTIDAGAGSDLLIGGAGADKLTGGDGVDTFRYLDITESKIGAGSDTIADFLHGTDIVDLSAIDANTEVQGNQGFTFIGSAAFSDTAGELRYDAGSGKLTGDIDGDGTADFQIVFANTVALTASDILL